MLRDREIGFPPLRRRPEAQTSVFSLIEPPAQHHEDRLDERNQVGQVNLRNLAGHVTEVESGDVAKQAPNHSDCILATEPGRLRVEPLFQSLIIMRAGVGKYLGVHPWRTHADHELAHVFRIFHTSLESKRDSVQFSVQTLPDFTLDSIGIAHRYHVNRLGLSIAAQPPNALVQAHRVPRQIDMDQGAAVLLQIDAFTGSFGGHQEAYNTSVESTGCPTPIFRQSVRTS